MHTHESDPVRPIHGVGMRHGGEGTLGMAGFAHIGEQILLGEGEEDIKEGDALQTDVIQDEDDGEYGQIRPKSVNAPTPHQDRSELSTNSPIARTGHGVSTACMEKACRTAISKDSQMKRAAYH